MELPAVVVMAEALPAAAAGMDVSDSPMPAPTMKMLRIGIWQRSLLMTPKLKGPAL